MPLERQGPQEWPGVPAPQGRQERPHGQAGKRGSAPVRRRKNWEIPLHRAHKRHPAVRPDRIQAGTGLPESPPFHPAHAEQLPISLEAARKIPSRNPAGLRAASAAADLAAVSAVAALAAAVQNSLAGAVPDGFGQ